MTDETEGDKPALVVSACLLGVACNHEGRASPRAVMEELGRRYRLVPVCPEVLGGLPTPRAPAELTDPDGARVMAGEATVVNNEGADVGAAYRRGAREAVAVALAAGARRAVLKARSPSCGASSVYDGSFSRRLVAGQGVTAGALRAAGLEVCSDEEASASADASADD